MMYTLINKQLLEIAERNKLNYNYNLTCFNLENENGYRLSVIFMIGGKYSFIIEINGHKKYLAGLSDAGLSDVETLFLLWALRDNLNDKSFPNALKEMYHTHEKIQETIKELKKGVEEQ